MGQKPADTADQDLFRAELVKLIDQRSACGGRLSSFAARTLTIARANRRRLDSELGGRRRESQRR